ncbi:MAG: HlyC/CorC family transporter [Agathobacter sp.]|nr:HlyC/CorC family transporter [Agathobacter sp.]
MEFGPGQIGQLVSILVLVFLSAFFSSSETALVTVNKIRMKNLAENGDKRAAKVLKVTSDSGKMLSAILIGNNIVNLSASSIATILAVDIFGDIGSGIATGVLTFVILVCSEVSPKTLATIKADSLALAIAGIIDVLMFVLTPFIFIINKLASGLLWLLRVDSSEADKAMTEDEIRTIVDESQESGAIEDEEREMIHNVFDFGDSLAKEVMVPRIDMTFVHVDASYKDLIEIYRENKYTRLPVYEESTDYILGIINMKDVILVEDTKNFSIRDIIREPYFTYEHKNTADLFIEMRQASIPLAIVLDEYGVTAGLVTLEDLLEEIVGEIRDEYDSDEEDAIEQLSEYEYMILGSTNLDDVNDALDLEFESDDYDTIGGYCLQLLDHLPEENETIFTEDGVVIKIEEVEKNRIERIYIRIPNENTETTEN